MSRNNDVQRADRLLTAIEYRRAGKSLREIGELLGCNASTVLRNIRAALKEQAECSESIAEVRDLELARYDRYLSLLEADMGAGTCAECGRSDVKVIEAALKVSKARRELRGVDAPTKTQAVEPDAVDKMSLEEKAQAHEKAAEELRAELAKGQQNGVH